MISSGVRRRSIHSGSLDELITILAKTETIDAVADEREAWSTYVQTWASKRDVRADERIRNPQISGELDAVFVIRHPGVALNSTMRVRDEADRIYQITGITEVEGRRRGFEIMAKGLDKLGATVA